MGWRSLVAKGVIIRSSKSLETKFLQTGLGLKNSETLFSFNFGVNLEFCGLNFNSYFFCQNLKLGLSDFSDLGEKPGFL